MLRMLRTWMAVIAIIGLLAQSAAADLYVLQVGDGAVPLGTTAAPLIVNKFANTGGAALATVPLPTTTSGANSQITVRGGSTTESFMDVSTNGQYLVLGGYQAAVGSAGPDATTVPRVVARIPIANFTPAGVDTSTVLTDAFLGSSFRSVSSTNGTDLWMAGNSSPAGSGGVRYTTFGSTTSTQVSNSTNNGRVVGIFNDAASQPQLYVSSGSGSFIGVNSVGTGLPTTSGQTMTNLPGTLPDSTNPMDFWFADANTLYKANGTGGGQGIAKFTFNAGTSNWDLQYTLNPGTTGTTGAGGITGVVSGSTTTLYATNYLNELVSIVDTGSGSTPTLLATAPTNTTFRGIAFVNSTPAGVQGDYNNNGIVDAADYVLWRNGGPLLNDPSAGVQATDYDFWRSRFGANSGSGSGAAVPEPAGAVLLLIGFAALGWRRRAA
jgi:hypothetical protein